MKKIKIWWMSLILLCGMATSSCSDDDTLTFTSLTAATDSIVYDMTGFARGADVSWLTEMENYGKKFYDSTGTERECMELLRELGMNSIRLRVWVNPTDGWCNKEDVMVKAWRASNLGYRLMIDFHYSDTWADPANQEKPAAWDDYTFDELTEAVYDHTYEVLSLLKSNDIDVEWVQVGNETRYGMLFSDGFTGYDYSNTSNFAELVNAGYDAVKAVYPKAQVIVHVDKGNSIGYYTGLFDALENAGGRWDIIGMSLYPGQDNDDGWEELDSNGDGWQQQNYDCVENMKTLISRYGKDVMMCEIGIPWNYDEAEAFYTDFMTKAKQVDGCLGVFTWEPESYGSWENYQKGMFDDDGVPMSSFNAFARD